jgi:hypothetical protein
VPCRIGMKHERPGERRKTHLPTVRGHLITRGHGERSGRFPSPPSAAEGGRKLGMSRSGRLPDLSDHGSATGTVWGSQGKPGRRSGIQRWPDKAYTYWAP